MKPLREVWTSIPPLRRSLLFMWLGLSFAGLLVLDSACGRPGHELPNFKDRDIHLTVLHTSDIHSRLLSYRFVPGLTDKKLGLDVTKGAVGGIARIATIIKRERAKSDRSIYLDSGDLFQGAPIFNAFQGEPELRTLSALGLDAYVLGNHDFDNGGLVLGRQISLWSTLPMLAANYQFLNDSRRVTADEMRKLVQPYTILNIKGYRIGVIGLANTSSMNSIKEGGNSLGMVAKEQNTTLQHYVNQIRSQVDIVVALTHLGLTEDQHLIEGYERKVAIKKYDRTTGQSEFKKEWMPGVRGVDIVVGGHHHVVLNPPKTLNDPDGREVLMIHSGAFAKYVGRLDVVIRNGEVKAHRFHPIPVNGDIPEDPDIARILEPYVIGLNQKIDTTRVFAYAPYLVPRFGRGTGDSALGNLVSGAMKNRRRVEADFALTNSLGIRTDLQAGPVSMEQFFEIFPFENTLATLYISGQEVQELLNFVTERSSGRGCQSQAQVAGISFVMNCAKRVAENICVGSKKNPVCKKGETKDCFNPIATSGPTTCVYGLPIKPFNTYKLAANDYIANGGSGFKVLQRNTTQFNTGVSLRDALIEYIESLPTCAKVNADRKKAGQDPIPVPKQYENLPCIIGKGDGRIRPRL